MPKLRYFALQIIPPREWKENPQNWGDFCKHLIGDLYPEYIKNICNLY